MKKNIPLVEVRKVNTIKELLYGSVELYANETAFLHKPEGKVYVPVTFKEYGEDVNALGLAFCSLGLKDGAKIAIVSHNRYAWGTTYMAAVNGDTVVVPIDKELNIEDIINLLNISEAEAVVYSADLLKKIENAALIKEQVKSLKYAINIDANEDNGEELSYNLLLEKGRELAKSGDTSFMDYEVDPDEMKVLLFTSGTTAMSKGVMLSHRNIVTVVMAMCSMVYIGPEDTFLSVLPIHHTYECTCGFLTPVYRGCAVAYADGLTKVAKNLKESGATIVLGVPQLFETMYKRIMATAKKNGLEKKMAFGVKLTRLLRKVGIDIRRKVFANIHDNLGGKLRITVSGAAAISPEVAVAFNDFGINLIEGYGITECAPIVSLTRLNELRPGSAGIAVPGSEIKIDNPGEDGIGEILYKGDNVMLGYYNNPEETAMVIKDGWFCTGDLGYMDKDGYVYITGRKKSVIVTKNGKNIFPEELEAFINANDYVLESLVYGSDVDTISDETEICAVLVPDMDKIGEDFPGADEEKIKELMEEAVDAVNKRNPVYKYIRKVTVRNTEFEKTTTRKVKRYVESNKSL